MTPSDGETARRGVNRPLLIASGQSKSDARDGQKVSSVMTRGHRGMNEYAGCLRGEGRNR